MNLKLIMEKVKRDLEKKTCHVHKKHGKFKITGTSEKPNIGVETCCDEFLEQIKKDTGFLLKKEVEKELEKDIKNIFKKL